MAKLILGDPNYEQRNLHLLRFIEDLKKSRIRRNDLNFEIEEVPFHIIESLKSVPRDLQILYLLIGEFQISHESGYAIFDLFLPQLAERFLSDWTTEEINEHGLTDKQIFGIEHVNQNIRNFLFYDIDSGEISMLIPNGGKNLLEILRKELEEITSN